MRNILEWGWEPSWLWMSADDDGDGGGGDGGGGDDGGGDDDGGSDGGSGDGGAGPSSGGKGDGGGGGGDGTSQGGGGGGVGGDGGGGGNDTGQGGTSSAGDTGDGTQGGYGGGGDLGAGDGDGTTGQDQQDNISAFRGGEGGFDGGGPRTGQDEQGPAGTSQPTDPTGGNQSPDATANEQGISPDAVSALDAAPVGQFGTVSGPQGQFGFVGDGSLTQDQLNQAIGVGQGPNAVDPTQGPLFDPGRTFDPGQPGFGLPGSQGPAQGPGNPTAPDPNTPSGIPGDFGQIAPQSPAAAARAAGLSGGLTSISDILAGISPIGAALGADLSPAIGVPTTSYTPGNPQGVPTGAPVADPQGGLTFQEIMNTLPGADTSLQQPQIGGTIPGALEPGAILPSLSSSPNSQIFGLTGGTTTDPSLLAPGSLNTNPQALSGGFLNNSNPPAAQIAGSAPTLGPQLGTAPAADLSGLPAAVSGNLSAPQNPALTDAFGNPTGTPVAAPSNTTTTPPLNSGKSDMLPAAPLDTTPQLTGPQDISAPTTPVDVGPLGAPGPAPAPAGSDTGISPISSPSAPTAPGNTPSSTTTPSISSNALDTLSNPPSDTSGLGAPAPGSSTTPVPPLTPETLAAQITQAIPSSPSGPQGPGPAGPSGPGPAGPPPFVFPPVNAGGYNPNPATTVLGGEEPPSGPPGLPSPSGATLGPVFDPNSGAYVPGGTVLGSPQPGLSPDALAALG